MPECFRLNMGPRACKRMLVGNNDQKVARRPPEDLTSNHFINRISRFLNKADPLLITFILNDIKEGGAVRGPACSSFPILLLMRIEGRLCR